FDATALSLFYPLSLHDALPIYRDVRSRAGVLVAWGKAHDQRQIPTRIRFTARRALFGSAPASRRKEVEKVYKGGWGRGRRFSILPPIAPDKCRDRSAPARLARNIEVPLIHRQGHKTIDVF